MRDGRTLLWHQKKRQSPQRIPIIQMRAVFVALSVKFQSEIRTTNGAFSHFLPWYIKLLPKPVGRTAKTSFPSSKRETASFCSRFNTNPPRQEADRRSKSKHSTETEFSWNWCHFGLSRKVMNVTLCHSSCQRSATLWWTLLSLRPIRRCRCWSN